MPNVIKAPAVIYESDRVIKLKTSINVESASFDQKPDMEEIFAASEKLQGEMLAKAKIEADMTVSEAVGKARMIIEDAEREAKIIKITMEESARKEGYEKGYEEGVAEAEKVKQAATDELDTAKSEKEAILAKIEPEVVELIAGVVDKLLPKVAKFNKETIVNLIKQGILGSTIKDTVTIHVSKDDYDITVEQKGDIAAFLDTSVELDIVADPALKANDCIIETSFGNIDCSLDAQYNTLRENLYYILENR